MPIFGNTGMSRFSLDGIATLFEKAIHLMHANCT